MMDAIQRLLLERQGCCAFYDLIVGRENTSAEEDIAEEHPATVEGGAPGVPEPEPVAEENAETRRSPRSNLNESQIVAMNSWRSDLSLIWGPPGNPSNNSQGVCAYQRSYRYWENDSYRAGPF